MTRVTLEICVDTPEGIAAAEADGADRIELCSALAVGGLTPSPGLIAAAQASCIPVHAMVRPVGGGFVLSDAVFASMLQDIAAIRAAGLAGVVLGALTPDRRLDEERSQSLIAAAEGLDVTLHRAIDLVVDAGEAVDLAARLGFARILSSGGEARASDGASRIAEMQARAAGRVEIMAGGGVTAENAPALVEATGVRAVHGSCSADGLGEDAFGFGQARVTDPAKVRAMRQTLDNMF